MVYPYKMEFASRKVVLALIFAAHIIKAHVCSKDDEVFRGFARDRSILSNTKTVRLGVSILSSVCDAGVYCREFCWVDSLEWNFFEVKKVCPNHS